MNWLNTVKNKISTTYHDVRAMKKVRELFLYPKESTLSNLSYILLILFFLSPVYRLLNSLTLDFHDPSFYFVNDSILARDLFHYLQPLGYFGLFIALFTIARSIIIARDDDIELIDYIKRYILPILLTLFLLLAFFSALFSDNWAISFYGHPYRKEGFITYLAYAGLFSAAYQLKSTRRIYCLLIPFLLSGTLLSIFSLLDIEYINNLFTLTKASSIFHNANHYAYFLNISILASILAIYLYKGKSRIITIVPYIILGLLTYTLIDNGSFGSYIGAVFGVTMLSIFVFTYHPKERKRLSVIVLIFLLSSLASSMDGNFIASELSKIAGGTSDIIEGNEQAPSAGSGRWSLWTQALDFTLEKPIFGYGVDNLGDAYLEAGNTSDRPHNEYLQIAASIGIPALIVYLSTLTIHFLDLLKNRTHFSLIIYSLYAIVFAYLVSAFFGNSMYYTTPYYIVFLALSIQQMQKESTNL